jgi:hypothetical protein
MNYTRSKVFTEVKISVVGLWVETPSSLIGGSGLNPEDGSDTFLRNVDNHLRHHSPEENK